jgi:ribose/xylose/arabinose/galactoside ABC-type transport system permease subunit
MSLQTTATISGWRQGEKIKEFLRAYGAVIGMVLVLGAVGVIQPGFLAPANVRSVLEQSTILIIMSLGLTVAMLLRGVDLSFAQVADAAGLMAAALIVHGQPIWLAFVAPLLLGLLIGCVNAGLMAYVGIPAIIGTLGTMFIIRSGELIYTHGSEPQILFTLPRRVTHDFLFLGQQSVGPVPALIILALVMIVIAWMLAALTPFARQARAVGSNVRAAYLAGIDIRLVFGAGFVISALLSAVAGIALVSRTGIAMPRGTEPYMMDAFAAVYLGTLASPRGMMNIPGTVIGGLFVAFLGNGLTLMGLAGAYHFALNGGFILLAMAVGALRREA